MKDNEFIFDIARFDEFKTRSTFSQENIQMQNLEISQN